MNYTLNVKELKLNTFILTSKIFDEKLLNNLIDVVKKSKADVLSYKTYVKGHFTGFKSLIGNNYFHSFLKLIQPYIYCIYQKNFIIYDAWGNLCKKGEEITEHHHKNFAFCGILYLSNGGPGTYFKDYNLTISEEIGKFVLFHSDLLHSVKKIEENIERITIAFNMNETEDWNQDLNSITWVNKNEI